MYVAAQAQGYGVAYFAKRMLADKGLSLEGKKCIVTGSNYVCQYLYIHTYTYIYMYIRIYIPHILIHTYV